jgi:ribosomal-protein-alanine N-acetyltransferase
VTAGGPLLQTERLRLRPLTPDDAEALHRLWTDPGVRQYLWDGEVIAREKTEEIVRRSAELFETTGLGLWAVLPRDSEALAGFCGYWFFRDPPELELLYGIAEEQWGRGLATEAARAMLRYGFEVLGFERIAASTDAANTASVRVMEKLGMTFDRRAEIGGLDTIFYSATR